ncbi:MAG: hypothetical protein PHD32_05320, partial [Eubacteriales bacterium]|nr:hypothetical protein [Eubacteriales bacterium]
FYHMKQGKGSKHMEEQVRQIFLAAGADVCGLAAAEALDTAPDGFRPGDIWPQCRSLIVFGLANPKGLTRTDPRLVYGTFNAMCARRVDEIAFAAARRMEAELGCIAIPLPCDGPYDAWIPEKLEGRGMLSMKHAAVAAGLGQLGKNTLLLNRKFGNRLSVGVVLTDLTLAGDAPAPGVCISGCRKCLDACPVGALDGSHACQLSCRPNAYSTNARGFDVVDCNRCRAVCPMADGRG